MALQDKYINPFTDFGFNELFDSELYKDLQNHPKALLELVSQKLFAVAENANFTPEEKIKFEERLKNYRDLKNMVDTAFEEGKTKAETEFKAKGILEIARRLKSESEPIEKIVRFTGLTIEEIENL